MAGLIALGWILTGGLLMSLIAMVGGLTALLPAQQLQQLLLPMISLAAGSLLGGAFFHMLPEGLSSVAPRQAGVWIMAGFTAFLVLEQGLHWHHSHRPPPAGAPPAGGQSQPLALLILLGDGLHNFVGGLGIASTFLLNPAAGVVAWLAAAAHELPQELGDFGVLVHCGWSRRQALRWNLVSALTFPLGGLLAWLLAGSLPLAGLVLFAAGNFLYIAASDLVPEIKARAGLWQAGVGLGWFAAGLLLMLLLSLPASAMKGAS